MKILTKEEEAAHYNATLKGGITGGLMGLAVGGAAVFGAHHRFPTFRSLTLPMKTFLVTSSGTFASIVSADRASRKFEWDRDPQRQYKDKATTDMALARENETAFQRFKEWGRENRYPIVTVSWVASMGIALGLVGRNPYLSRAQKLVQARVYAQGLTLAVLIATAAFEVGDASKGKGRWETVKILDPNDPEHKHLIEKRIHHEAYEGEDLWRDMVAAEERKMTARKTHEREHSHKSNDEERKSSNKDSKSRTPAQEEYAKTGKQASHKEHKDQMQYDHKSAGKVDYKEAEETESKNQAEQHKREKDTHGSAVQDDVQVKGRGKVA